MIDVVLNVGELKYLNLLERILRDGVSKGDRTGTGTISLFGDQLRFDLQEGFPLLTTKKLFTKAIFGELAWLIRGETNIKSLNEIGVTIWDEWADENGNLGPVYGKQWRSFSDGTGFYCGPECRTVHTKVDQLQNALDLIKKDPNSRRIVVSAWNPVDLDQMALSPCHMSFQFEVHDGELSCHMYQRSADVFLGVPFNIASYAALTHVMAELAGLAVGELIISFGDVHIYNNHIDQVVEQLKRMPRRFPELEFARSFESLDDVRWDDFVVKGYDPHPSIKAEVSV